MSDLRQDSRLAPPLGIIPAQAGMTIEEALNLAFAVRRPSRSYTPLVVAASVVLAIILLAALLLQF